MRSRNIKPGFYLNERLSECQPLARILFTGLWCCADREGRLEDRPKRIKAQVLPYDNCDCDALLQELAAGGFIVRYVVEGERFIAIPEFLKHQKPHPRENASAIPRHDLGNAKVVPSHGNAGTGPADIPHPDIPHPDCLKEQKRASPSAQQAKGTRLPDDWQPTPEQIAWAKAKRPDLDPALQAEMFRDYWHAKPGKDGRKVDWQGTWRNWIRNGRAIARPPPLAPRVGGSPEKPPEDPKVAAAKHAAYMRELTSSGERV